MHELMILTLFVLYLAVLLVKRPEMEPYFWLKVSGLGLLSFFIFSLGHLHFPLGILIGFWIVKRKTTQNLDLKYLALFFALVYFVLRIMLPPLDFGGLNELRQEQKYMNLFTSVESVTAIPPDSQLQQELRKYVRSGEGYPPGHEYAPIFRAWILDENGIYVEDSSQIYENWWKQGHVSESHFSTNNTTQIIYVDFREKHYLGIFKREHEDAPFRLHEVIDHNGFRPGVPLHFPW